MNIITHNSPNYYPSRRGAKPIAICLHITAGSLSGTIAWFNNPKSSASSHFTIGRDGSIHQHVSLEDGAWTEGIMPDAIPFATAPIVKVMGTNPNLYMCGIEHEGYEGNGVDGTLTEEQFLSSCLVQKYIQDYVQTKWGNRIDLNPYNVVGHFQVDPRRKPFCPGKNFPWARMYGELAVADSMELEAYEERIDYLRSNAAKRAQAYALVERINDLSKKLTDPTWGTEARKKILRLTPCLEAIGYAGDVTAEGIATRINAIYQNSLQSKFEGEAFRKIGLATQCAKEAGLI